MACYDVASCYDNLTAEAAALSTLESPEPAPKLVTSPTQVGGIGGFELRLAKALSVVPSHGCAKYEALVYKWRFEPHGTCSGTHRETAKVEGRSCEIA